MKIATWNVNSLRVRLPHVREWLLGTAPDILALQEIKMPTENFPAAAFADLGYQSAVNGQKTYNGVCLLSRQMPTAVVHGIPGFEDQQNRVLSVSYGALRVVDVYVPNGQSVDSDKYQYKLRWFKALRDWLQHERRAYPQLLVLGDFNIAPEDRDVHDPDAWRGQVLCSEAERAELKALMSHGFVDVFRQFSQPEGTYSWWDYRAGAFRRNRGLRIDLILSTSEFATNCMASAVDIAPRKLAQPSDHAPVWANFAD